MGDPIAEEVACIGYKSWRNQARTEPEASSPWEPADTKDSVES